MMNVFSMRNGSVLVLVAVLGLGGCAATPEQPSFGQQVAAEGGAVSKIGQDWNEGETLIKQGQALVEDGEESVDDGESLVRKGEKKLSEGRSDISKGERMIAKGERMKREAEAAYRNRKTSTQPTT